MAKTKQSTDAPAKKAPKKAPKKVAIKSDFEAPIMVNLKLDCIQLDPNNPRKHFDDTEMDELIESVRENGVLQPIVVRPLGDDNYIIIAGERRYRAAAAVATDQKERNSIPAVIKMDIEEGEARSLQIIENIQRAEMHPMDEAQAFLELHNGSWTSIEDIAAKVGKSIYYVRRRLALNQLSSNWIQVYMRGHINHSDALKLAALGDESQEKLFTDYYRLYPIRILDHWIDHLQHKLSDGHFDQNEDYDGLPKCGTCPFNSAFNSLFPGEEKEAYCKNRKCFDLKEAYQLDQMIERHKDDPSIVLIASEHSADKSDIEAWKSNGLEIYNIYDFNEIEEPDKEDYDLDPEAYDDGVKDEDYKYELERYHRDLKEYEEDLGRPDLVKGIVMSGPRKGEISLGYMDKMPRLIGQSDDKRSESRTDEPKSVADEIWRIESKEERAKELDGEKIWSKVVGLLDEPENRAKIFNDSRLFSEEIYAAAFSICRKMGHEHNKWIREFFGDTSDSYTYELPKEISSKMLIGLIRMLICDVMVTNYGSHLNKDSAAGIVFPILKNYFEKEIAVFEIEQQEIAEKRQERVDKRIADLKNKEE